ncbi:MFS transporter [Streptomyces sp. DSM 42041]|uniref:MFS transporter n=1 Tax=Streptomyces hazeniae TaxID=3075538 RepID=A0ABU2NXU6_9ACTN|nr:MFS transporter [Streptomyces sp. DSM 42041]MDT0381352.1 MFS transporter [Streptomyces sp. DSM 42041]
MKHATTGRAAGPVRARTGGLFTARYLSFLSAMGLSSLGDAAWYVTLAWTLTETTSPGTAGAVLALASLPQLLTLLGGGAVADSAGPRRVMYRADVARAGVMVVAAGLVAVTGPDVVVLVVAAAALSLCAAFFVPASGAFRARLLPREHLVRGNALYLSGLRGGQALGGPLGGGLLALGGVPLVAAVNAATFGLAAFAVRKARGLPGSTEERARAVEDAAADAGRDAPPPAAIRTFRQQIADGLRTVVRRPHLRSVMLVIGLVELSAGGPVNVGIVLLAGTYGSGAGGAGLLLTLFTVGATAGFLLTLVWPARRRAGRVVLLGSVVQTGCLASLAMVSSLHWALVPYCLIGLVSGVGGIVLVSLVQRWSPESARGRVMSVQALLIFGAAPLGNLLIGVLAEGFGMRAAFATHAALAGCAALTLLLVRPLREARLD